MSQSTLLSTLFRYKAWANEELIRRLAEPDAASHPSELNAAIRILNHIYVVDRIFSAHLRGVRHAYTGTNTVETPTLDELRAAVQVSDGWYVGYAATVSSHELGENIQFEFTDATRGQMSREEMLVHVSTHGAYHRGAVGRIMAQLSLSPPRDLFTGYLHQSEPARRLHS